ncbi:uncharacterized protein LOC114877088 [Osmia bicornis bicornis]|uniref:uncharacterized protein LOC114877088 n=1 Tax=Osmia bicornis bicornis TaxID=1437191 RepID=UPI001EAEFE5C|nr:uncharacterized protein LOC114877088 [Osmia bicornis bicornis]
MLDWMVQLFTPKVWYAILWTYLLLSICSYACQKTAVALIYQKLHVKLSDHVFYNFGVMCGQNYIPPSLLNSSNLVELWLNIFSTLIRTCFGAIALCYMAKTITVPPFSDLSTLISSSSYHLLVKSGSLMHILLKASNYSVMIALREAERYTTVETIDELYRIGCSTNKLFAISQSVDIKKATGLYICRLNPVGESVYTVVISSGIARNFEYKKSIDIGIIKLYEFGIMNRLKQYWIESNNVEEEESNEIDPVNMEEVFLMLVVFGIGVLTALVILILEKLTDPYFAAFNQEIINRSRERETHNFQGKVVRFTYFEQKNLVSAEANGTKVSGAIGEMWHILAQHLNFTLKPILSKYPTLGGRLPNGSFDNGLLKIIQANETDVIPRVEASSKRTDAAQFSMPLWITSQRFYIKRNEQHLLDWMVQLFAPKVWYAIVWTYLLLSVCSYACQKTAVALTYQKLHVKLSDHVFYNFGVMCGQNYIPPSLLNSSNLVELWLNIFSTLIRTCFGAIALCYMAKTFTVPPFSDLSTLINSSSYHILVKSGSFAHITLMTVNDPYVMAIRKTKRYTVVETIDELYRMGCSTNKLFTVVQTTDRKKANGLRICQLKPVGESVYTVVISSGIARNFEYKKSIDVGIIKLYEFGLMNRLKQYWIESNNVEKEESNEIDPVNMEEVFLILIIFGIGVLTALVILILEKLTFYYTN